MTIGLGLSISFGAGIILALIIIFFTTRKKKEGFTFLNESNQSEGCNMEDLYSTVSDDKILGGLDDKHVSSLLEEKYKRPLEYRETRERLPKPDPDPLFYNKDTRDPFTHLYERNITGPIKYRHQGEGDFLRGDLPICPRKEEWCDKWYDSQHGPEKLKQGAFTRYFTYCQRSEDLNVN